MIESAFAAQVAYATPRVVPLVEETAGAANVLGTGNLYRNDSGSYLVTATLSDPNYAAPSASGRLVIGQA